MKIIELIINLLRPPKKKEVREYNCLTIRLPLDMYFPSDDCNIDKNTDQIKVREDDHA